MKQRQWFFLSLLSAWSVQIVTSRLQIAPHHEYSVLYYNRLHKNYCYATDTVMSTTSQNQEHDDGNDGDHGNDDDYDDSDDLHSIMYHEMLAHNQYTTRLPTNPYKYYYECTNAVLTTGQRLAGIRNIPDSLVSIAFKDSNISLIPVGVFTEFINLSELHLNNSFVDAIHPGAFTGLTKLQKLYLQDNNITKISKGILNSLPDLNLLNLSNNHLEIIEEHAFIGLFSLQEIYLNNNSLKELLPGMFHRLNRLQKIDLSYNLLSEIPLDLFSELHFESLSDFIALSNNNFSKIDFSVFPRNLQHLKLQNNHINYINNWSHLQSVIYLDLSNNTFKYIDHLHETLMFFNLSGNLIEVFNKSLFALSKNLISIDLSRNLIKNINDNTFEGLENLTNLFLQNNQIKNIPIGCFRDLQSLHVLNLSSNEISEFEYGTFSGLSSLKFLDISGNKLAYLYESSFHDLRDLEVLNIQENLITSFDPHDLADHSQHLKTVFLNNNPWVCKSLLNIVKTLEKHNVTIVKGSTEMKTAHVRGIACLNYNLYNATKTFIADNFENNTENASLVTLYRLSSEMNAFRTFFNRDFLNSSFYKYFENFKKFNSTLNFNDSNNKAFLKYFDEGFKNTTFYKYFDKDFSNNSFFEHFNTASERLSTALNSLDADFKNSSLYNFVKSDAISQNISKYFDNGFKSSAFYKYFTKEFSNSEFFKYFDKTLQTRIDSSLLKIGNYFDNDFKNSTFFTFFDEDRGKPLHSNFINHSDFNGDYARLIDSTPQINNDDIVLKISELTDTIKAQANAMKFSRNGTAVFMTIVVIILLAITFLLAVNNFRTRFKQNVCKSVSYNTESQMHIADAEIEMM